MTRLNRKGQLASAATGHPVWKPAAGLSDLDLQVQGGRLGTILGVPTEQAQDIIRRKGEFFAFPNLYGEGWNELDSLLYTGRTTPELTSLAREAYGLDAPAAVVAPAPAPAIEPVSRQLAAAERLSQAGAALSNPAAPAPPAALSVPEAVRLAGAEDLWGGGEGTEQLRRTVKPTVAVEAEPVVADELKLVAHPVDAPANAVVVPDFAPEAAAGADLSLPIALETKAVAADTLDPAKPLEAAAPASRSAAARRSRRQQARANASAAAGAPEQEIDGAQLGKTLDRILSAPDFGLGGLSAAGLREAARGLRAQNLGTQAARLERLAALSQIALPVAATAASIGIPVALAAGSGNETAGGGGALLQGSGALMGSLVGARMGTPGRLIGGLLGGGVSGALVGGGRSAVDAANAGDTGLVGSIGNALDPLLDSQREVDERQLRAQLNSPIVKQMKEDERQQRHQQMMDQMQMALMQSYLS